MLEPARRDGGDLPPPGHDAKEAEAERPIVHLPCRAGSATNCRAGRKSHTQPSCSPLVLTPQTLHALPASVLPPRHAPALYRKSARSAYVAGRVEPGHDERVEAAGSTLALKGPLPVMTGKGSPGESMIMALAIISRWGLPFDSNRQRLRWSAKKREAYHPTVSACSWMRIEGHPTAHHAGHPMERRDQCGIACPPARVMRKRCDAA
jgi:hypothetical protein